MPEITPETRHQCRHIHASGHRCGSPSLRSEPFCYFHHTSRRPVPQSDLDRRRGHQASFAIPSLEDRTAIQLALAEVLNRIATHDLDPRRAGLLLYGLQIAAANLPKPAAQPVNKRNRETVDEVVFDEQNGPLAPEREYKTAQREKGLEQILLEQWRQDEEDEAIRAQERLQQEARPDYMGPIASLQAVAESRSTLNSSVLKILPKSTGGTPHPIRHQQAGSCSAYGFQLKVDASSLFPSGASPRNRVFPPSRPNISEKLSRIGTK